MSLLTLIHHPPTTFLHLNLKSNPRKLANYNLTFTPKFVSNPPKRSPISLKSSSSNPNLQSSSNSISSLKPYILAEWKLILRGWGFAAVSVFSLSRIVPKAGKFASILSDVDVIKRDGVVLAALFGVRLVANYLQQACLWEAAFNLGCRVRVYVFERVLERDLGFFEGGGDGGVSAGDIAHRITTEAVDVADTVFALFNTIVPSTLQLSAMGAQMLLISPVLTLVSALVVPCVALAITFLGARLQRISRRAHLSFAALSAYLNEVLPSVLFVKASNMELSESIRFRRLAYTDLSKQLKKKKMKALIPQIVQAVYFGALFVFCAGSLVLSRGSHEMCSLISFITSLVFLVEPIQAVGKAYNEWKQGEPAIERLFDLTRFRPKVTERPDAVDIDSVNGEVKFCDISFRYRDDLPVVLDGVDLHIKAGETIALVGPSGGGKSTLVKLLLRLYDPLGGSILIDGHDIRSLRLESLRRNVALVSQDITLFSGTVAENIGYIDLVTEIDMERVRRAAKTANADEFISSLPRGYETLIGSRGSTLSGGQKQRLAIARALYQNSSILIMDEATSALDSKSALLVRQAVERVMENHTVLVIAHRLDTVLMAERVLLLENGKLQQIDRSMLIDGSHDLQSSAGIVI